MSQKSVITTTFTASSNESLNKPPYASSQSSGDNMTSSGSTLANHYPSVGNPTIGNNNTMFMRQQAPILPPPPPPPTQETLYGSVVASRTSSDLENISLSSPQQQITQNYRNGHQTSPAIYGALTHQNDLKSTAASNINNSINQHQPIKLINDSHDQSNLVHTTNSSPNNHRFYHQQQSPNCTNQRSSTSSLDSSSSMPLNVQSMLLHGVSGDEVLQTWLASIKCEDYLKNFVEHGYDMHLVTRMTPQDLSAIGCKSPALRKKLLLELKKLNLPDDMPEIKPPSLDKWLELLKLGEYYPRLVSEGYDTIDKVCQLTWEDLEEIGITKLGHQKRILLGMEKIKCLAKKEEESFNDNSIYDVHPNHRISLNGGDNRLGTLGRVRSGFFQTRSGANLDHRGLPVAKIMPAFKHVNSPIVMAQANNNTNGAINNATNNNNNYYDIYHRPSSTSDCNDIQANYDNFKTNGHEEVYKMSDMATTLKRIPPPSPPVRTNSLKGPHDGTAPTSNINNDPLTHQESIYGVATNRNNNNSINYIPAATAVTTNSTSFLRTPKLGTSTATTNKMLTLGGHIQTITSSQTNSGAVRSIAPIREAPLPPVQRQSTTIPEKIDEEPSPTATSLVNGQYVTKQFNISSEINSSLIGHQLASADEFPPPPPCQ